MVEDLGAEMASGDTGPLRGLAYMPMAQANLLPNLLVMKPEWE